jgi:hypothetical protein
MGQFTLLIIFGIFILIKVLSARKKAADAQKPRQQWGAKQIAAQPPQGERQSADELIRGFLREMTQAQGAPPVLAPQVPHPDVERMEEEIAEAVEVVEPEETAQPARPPLIVEPVAPPPRPSPVAPARRRPRRARAQAAAPAPAVPPAPAAARPKALPDAVYLGLTDLRKAVIWSEVLGPPVALRRRIGHRPPLKRP